VLPELADPDCLHRPMVALIVLQAR
jgi:hypothetical protein